MIYATPLLFGFSRGVSDARLDGAEGEISIPTTLFPIVTLRTPLQRFTGFSRTERQEGSFATDLFSGRAASQVALANTICTFARGHWEISVRAVGLANYTQVSDGAVIPQMAIQLLDDELAIYPLMHFFAVNAVPQLERQVLHLLFPSDGWIIRNRLEDTGVGETHVIACSIYANRLH